MTDSDKEADTAGRSIPLLCLEGVPDLHGALQDAEDPSGCGAASPSQGRWDPDSLRPALSLGAERNQDI